MPSSSRNRESSFGIVVAIDGPAGAGKSTIAKTLASKLQFSYIDTGAMYRALTLKAILNHLDLENGEALVALAKQTLIELKPDKNGTSIYLDGVDVSKEIRTVEVTNKTVFAARTPGVRSMMVQWQKEIGEKTNCVIEGRDVTTVVFPNAKYKFYLDADVQERSRRRVQELHQGGNRVDEQEILEDMKERDRGDFTRKVGPLKIAQDAVVIDSSKMTVEQVVEEMLEMIDVER